MNTALISIAYKNSGFLLSLFFKVVYTDTRKNCKKGTNLKQKFENLKVFANVFSLYPEDSFCLF